MAAPRLISLLCITAAAVAHAHTGGGDTAAVAVDSTDVFFRHLQLQEVTVMGPAGEVRLKDAPVHVAVAGSRELQSSAGSNIHAAGRHIATLRLIASNLTDAVYQSHLSRLKYTAVNPVTGERGIAAPGRNVTLKLSFPIEW